MNVKDPNQAQKSLAHQSSVHHGMLALGQGVASAAAVGLNKEM